MTHIPTPEELAAQRANNDEAARRARIASDVTAFTQEIVAAMGKGERYLSVRTRMPEPEAQTQLIADFRASGWELSFQTMRTGGSIKWSRISVR